MADEQPLQAHLRNKSAKEPSAKERGTARGSVNSTTGWISKRQSRKDYK